MSERVVEDLLHDLRRIYDTNLEDISTLALQTARERPAPVPAQPGRVMTIWGMRQVNTGPARTRPDTLETESIQFTRNTGTTIDIWNVDTLEQVPEQIVYARTPLLFRRGDDVNIDFRPRQVDRPALLESGDTLPNFNDVYRPIQRDDWGNRDGIMLLGNVIEALGQTITDETDWRRVDRAIARLGRRKEPTPEQLAKKLLYSYLPKEDKQTWQKGGYILVPSKARPAFTYEITNNLVYLLNQKMERIESYCVVASEREGYVPQDDVTLSKYLLLQANEGKFRKTANRTVLHDPEPSNVLRGYGTIEQLQRPRSEALQRLEVRRDTVDIGSIGIQAGIYAGFTPIDVRSLEDQVVRFGTAQALLDGIAEEPGGLAVRDILPDRDLQYRRRR